MDNTNVVTASYINGLGIDNKLRVSDANGVQYFLADHLGSTNALTDTTGTITSSASYDSFGNPIGNLATRYQYTGREFDVDIDLYYYRARFYNAELGRFISEDPIGFAGGDVNLYGYVRNQPLIYRDALGLYLGNDITTVITSPEVQEAVSFVVSDPFARTAIATTATSGVGVAKVGVSSALAYGATSAGAVGAGTVGAVVVGGLAIGGVIGGPIGIITANLPSNPVVNGSLNPFGKSASQVSSDPWTPQKPGGNGCGDSSSSNPNENCKLDAGESIKRSKANKGVIGSVCVYRCKDGYEFET